MIDQIEEIVKGFPAFLKGQFNRYPSGRMDFAEDRIYYLVHGFDMLDQYKALLCRLVENGYVSCPDRLILMRTELDLYFTWRTARILCSYNFFRRDFLLYAKICDEVTHRFDVHETHLRRSLHHHERTNVVNAIKHQINGFPLSTGVVDALYSMIDDCFDDSDLKAALDEPGSNRRQMLAGFAMGISSDLAVDHHPIARVFDELADRLVMTERFTENQDEEIRETDHLKYGRILGHMFFEELIPKYAAVQDEHWTGLIPDLFSSPV